MFAMPGTSHRGALPDLTAEERVIEGALRRQVRVLAEEIGARSTAFSDGLERARAHVERAFREAGY